MLAHGDVHLERTTTIGAEGDAPDQISCAARSQANMLGTNALR